MGGRHNGLTASEPFGRSRLVEGSRLGVKLHVARVDARAVDPWVVEVVLTSLDQENLQVPVKVRETCLISIAIWLSG